MVAELGCRGLGDLRRSGQRALSWSASTRRAWVVASSSAREGWGLTLTEAAACGTPAVATRIAGHADAVRDGRSGLLVPGTAEALGGRARRSPHRPRPPPAPGGRRPGAGGRAVLGGHRPGRSCERWPPRPSAAAVDGGARRGPGRCSPFVAVVLRPAPAHRPRAGGADTKSYLYLDPGRLLARAGSMWDPHVGLGTVTHQNIGYLWPMGPCYWVMEQVGVPDWVAQRLWLGSIIVAAGFGTRYLLRTLGWRGPAVGAAMVAYAFTPYVLTIAARISAILLPFAGLPWLIALSAKAIRTGSWRYPAALRPHRHHRRHHQRHRRSCSSASAPSSGWCGSWRCGRCPRRRVVAAVGAHRRAHRGCHRLVDRRSVGPGHLRHRRPPVHGVGGGHGRGLLRPGGAPGARLLVLLRRRPRRSVGGAQPPVPVRCPAPGGQLRRAHPGPGGRCGGPVERAHLLRRPDGRRAGAGGGNVPLRKTRRRWVPSSRRSCTATWGWRCAASLGLRRWWCWAWL